MEQRLIERDRCHLLPSALLCILVGQEALKALLTQLGGQKGVMMDMRRGHQRSDQICRGEVVLRMVR